jgi:hypothetical protein
MRRSTHICKKWVVLANKSMYIYSSLTKIKLKIVEQKKNVKISQVDSNTFLTFFIAQNYYYLLI